MDGTTTLTSTDWVLEPPNGPPYFGFRIKASSPNSWGTAASDGNYENAISVAAKWGYSASVPNDIKYACLRLTRWFYRQRNDDTAITSPIVTTSGATIMPVSMPEDVKSIIALYRRMIFA